MGGSFSESAIQTGATRQDLVLEQTAPTVVGAPEPTQKPEPVINYNPQYTTIVVINSIVLHPKKKPVVSSENRRPAFQSSFDDRRFIHPSVFDGGSRQFIHPELFPSSRR
jgi:hypothetical protein